MGQQHKLETQSAEIQLLTICLHRNLSADQKQRAIQLQPDLDSDQLLKLARLHGVEPQLYQGLHQLRDQLTDHVPLIDTLAQTITVSAILYEFVYPQQLASILSALDTADIETLIIKGYFLGEHVYGQAALRTYGDFDVLIHKVDLEAAEQILVQLGYQPDDSDRSPNWFLEHHHHAIPYLHENMLPVELHWNLSHNKHDTRVMIDVDALWRQSQPYTVNGVPTRMLCPEHQLIYLGIHALNTHLFQMGLKGLSDIYETLLTYNDQLDWETVIVTCHNWRCSHHVYLLLEIVQIFFEITLPQVILQQLNQGGFDPKFLVYGINNLLITDTNSWELAEVIQERKIQQAANLTSRKLFPTRQVIATHYNLPAQDWRIGFYYLAWQFRLLRQVVGYGKQLLRKDPAISQLATHEATRRDMLEWLKHG